MVHAGATIHDVISFMHTYGYRAFFADGVGELTHLAKVDADTAASEIMKKVCPNFLFLRADLDVALYTNPLGCGERRL